MHLDPTKGFPYKRWTGILLLSVLGAVLVEACRVWVIGSALERALRRFGTQTTGWIETAKIGTDGKDTLITYTYRYRDHQHRIHCRRRQAIYDVLWIAHAAAQGEIAYDWQTIEDQFKPGAAITIYYWPVLPFLHTVV